MDAPSITGDALSHYRKHADNLPALAFCTSVAHAHHVADRFRAAGISALALDGGTHKDIRRRAVADFKVGAIKVITQCEIATEGWDLPGVHCGIFLRPTQSLGLWIQMTGRCSRVSPGKTHAILLDHTGNCKRLGLPDEPRDWQLTTDVIKRKRAPELSIRICPKCWAASSSRALQCRECGQLFEVKPRQEVEEREGELVELTAEEIARKKARREQGRARTLEELTRFARIKGYHENWALRVWQAREEKKRAKETA
jgi:superfamily II DNA or RNA helicase